MHSLFVDDSFLFGPGRERLHERWEFVIWILGDSTFRSVSQHTFRTSIQVSWRTIYYMNVSK